MRRNFLKAGLLTLVSAMTLSFAITAATTDGWQKQGEAPRAKTHVKQVLTPRMQYKRAHGVVDSNTQLRPLGDGIQRTPIKMRQGRSVLRTFENPKADLYTVVPRYTGQEYTFESFLGKLDIVAGTLTPVHYGSAFCPYTGSDFTFQTNCYRKGYVYCPFENLDMVTQTSTYSWKIVNIETGEVEAEVNFGSNLEGSPYTLTYDENHDVFYGLALGTGVGNQLCKYDPSKFKYDGTICDDAITYMGDMTVSGNYLSAIAYYPVEDKLYGFDQYNTVYNIDVTGEFGEAHTEGYLDTIIQLCEEVVTTPLVYSPRDEMFICTYPDNSIKKNVVYFIEPDSWQVYEGVAINSNLNPYFASLICTDELADHDAPELAAAPVVNFEKNNLTGSVTFTTPEFTYYGIAIGSAELDVTVSIDDKVIYQGKMAPNTTKTIDATLAEGKHTLTLVTAIDGKESPTRTVYFYAGNDTPFAPTNLELNINKLTWDAPASIGVNGGYVDVDLLEYDIFIDGKQQNSAPVEECEFTLRNNSDLKRCKIEVKATANGKVSAPATIEDVLGRALTLPQSFGPTREQFKLFTVINANDDTQTWFASIINEDGRPVAAFNIGYFVDADDWLILPPMNFPSADELYNLAFSFASPGSNDISEESFEIYLAKKPKVDDLLAGTCIYKRDLYSKSTMTLWDDLSFNFVAQEPGDYYIGIHCYSSKENNSAGMYLRDFEVKAVEGKTSGAPGDSKKITIIPGEYGDQSADIQILVADTDMAGKPLDPEKTITYDVYCEQTQDAAKGSGKPGETITINCAASGMDGYADFCITPSNENGSGYTRVRRAYVGIDTPLAPVNIQGFPSEDNMSMLITWEKPGDVGENGGYVDTDALTYNIYTRSGVTYYKVGSTKALSTTFNATNEKLDDYYVGPAAANEAGESVGSRFVQEQLGKAYNAPVKEYWNSTGFTMNPYTYATTNEYALSTWENTSYPQAFGDDFANAQCQQGALFSYSMVGHTETKLNLPKISTQGLYRANFSLRFWDYKYAPELRIYARYYGQLESKLIGTITPNKPARGMWNEAIVNLPSEVLNQQWVQFSIEASLIGADTEYLVFDTWSVYPDCEYDLGITSFTGSTEAALGDQLKYNCLVTTSGTEPTSGKLTVDLVDENGKVYATSQHVITNLPSLAVSEFNATFDLTGEFHDVTRLTARATIEADNDELENNNQREISVDIKSALIPVVSDLKGNAGEKGVTFTWSTPTCQYGDFDNFEYHPAFVNTETIGSWKNVDLDGHEPAVFQNGSITIAWDGCDAPSAWTVVDAEALGLQNDPRAYTHSGKQYIMARAAKIPDNADPRDYQSSDWLISPRVQGGSILSFWVNTLSTDTEYFEVWYSTTGTELGTISQLRPNDCGDFKGRKAYSKSGNDTWEQIVYQIPNNAKYVAIRYCAYDGLAVFIDDISITPVELFTGTADHYALYRSDNGKAYNKVADNIVGNTYTDDTYADTNANYYLVCASEIDGIVMEGPKSNKVFIASSAVADITDDNAIIGGSREIILIGYEGQKADIYTTDGKIAYSTTVRAQQARFGLEPGIYVVKVADRQTKVVVK
ncbi:MAG: hypothetical protein K2H86_02245 [Muribaculaceae bacterium]|nr:hypothetical protein [Muribaculaceae bacterium]